MNKKQRTEIATRLAAIAAEHGAHVTTQHHAREVWVRAKWPGKVSTSFEIDNAFNGGILAPWHDAEQPLALTFADSVNPFHRRKATLYRDSADAFADAFAECCRQVQTGEAFGDA